MTGVPDEDPALDVRAGFAWSADRLSDPVDLVPMVHQRARGIRRRRATVAGAVTAAVALGIGLGVPAVSGQFDGADTAGAASPGVSAPVMATGAGQASGAASVSASGGASGAATSGRATGVASAPVAPSGAGSALATGWGPVTFHDEFGSSTLDRSLWTLVYDGPGGKYGNWSPTGVSVADGALRLSVARTGAGSQPVTFGGIGASGFTQRYGRWELRWRMTAGRGVIGQFVLSPQATVTSGQEPTYSVTVSAATGQVSVSGAGAAVAGSVSVAQPTGYHTVVVEWTPQRLRTLVDGAAVAESAGPQPAEALWPALQAWLPGPDCGASPLPADCGGATTSFPQALDVDWIKYQPYTG